MKTQEFTIVGVTPLLMHNGQLCNPRNDFSKALKEISAKRKKTDADHEEMARIEFLGGLYVDEDGCPCIPGELLEAALINGAKKLRKGPAAKSGIICDGNFRLDYKGPKTAEKLYEDDNFVDTRPVRIQQNRIMRTRPIFKNWSLTFTVTYDENTVNESDVRQFVERAGVEVGLGNYRPRFGRFEIAN